MHQSSRFQEAMGLLPQLWLMRKMHEVDSISQRVSISQRNTVFDEKRKFVRFAKFDDCNFEATWTPRRFHGKDALTQMSRTVMGR